MRRFSPDFTPRLSPASVGPQPALEQLLPRTGRFREHAGIGIRALEASLESHHLVAAERVDRHRLSGLPLRKRWIQPGLSRAQAIDGDDHIPGSDARLLRRAAFEHVRDGGVIPPPPPTYAEHRQPPRGF